jgi:serine/threonine protein kinase
VETANAIREPALGDEDFHRVEELFQAAADLTAAERDAFLTNACGGDEDLRGRVGRLLDRLDQETLASPEPAPRGHGGPFALAAMTEGPGAVIDRYKLLQVIGEGGFGVVYMAEQQQPVVRKVALKIIKFGMDTRDVVARFEAERQALAMMDHPNIAKVLDGGATKSGRPYFVMELVRGVAITEFCDKNNLSTRERLELFSQVCQAVQHAHQKGVIHRDIKPSNVMVTLRDGTPMPKVIDFGVAKAMHTRLTEKTLFTRFEQFVGTPAYMSPEQAEMSALDVDTRTDIYSLGVLLYELLTGTTPFDTVSLNRAGLAEILRIIREEQPVRPSLRISTIGDGATAHKRGSDVAGLSRTLRGDLDWIVMKTLEKERGRRYATAGELADDVRRHLTNEPVMAGPPSTRYRLQKFFARNRAVAVSALIVLLTLFAGIVATTTAMLQSERNADLATEQAERAMTAVDFLLSTLSLANPEIALNPDTTIQTLLGHTSAKVAESFADYPGAEVRVRATIGRAYARLGEYELAEPHLRRVVEIVDALDSNGRSSRKALLAAGFDDLEFYAALWTLTNVCFNLDRPDSYPMANRAQEVGLAQIGKTDPEVAAAWGAFQARIEAGAWSHAPDAMESVPEMFGSAIAATDAALEVGDPRWPIVADACLAAGYTVWYTPHEPLAERFWREALAIQQRELPGNHPDIAASVNLLVGILNSGGKLDESEVLIRDSIEKLRQVHRKGAVAIARAEGTLGETLTRQGRFAEAEPLLLTSYSDIMAAVKRESNYMALESLVRVVELYDGWGKPDEATRYREALGRAGQEADYVLQWEVLRHAFGPEHSELVAAGDDLKRLCSGVSYLASPGGASSPELLEVSQAVAAQLARADVAEPRSAGFARLLLGLVNAIDPQTHVEARRVAATAAWDVLQHWTEELPSDCAEALAVLSSCAGATGDAEGAQRYAGEAWAMSPQTESTGSWFAGAAEVRIGRSLLEAGMVAEAEKLLTSGYAALQTQLGSQHLDTMYAGRLLQNLYQQSGRAEEARKYQNK